MDRDEMYELWQRHNDRPAFVREYREELMAHLSVDDPIPESDSLAQIRDWMNRYAGTVSRQLNDDSDGSDPHDAETTTEDGGE